MKFANVVPVRRMPAQRPWLTYAVPDGLLVEPGTLVTIPLRGRPIVGVVWSISSSQPGMKVQTITQRHLETTVMTDWQRTVCQAMATTGSTSLGDVLLRIIPKLTAKRLEKLLSGPGRATPPESVQSSSWLWYRHRPEALNHIRQQLQATSNQQVVIITPTNDDAEELVSLSESVGRTAVHVHSLQSPTDYASWHNRCRRGETLVAVGGITSLALPFPQTPYIILDQEEHHAHKQSAQFPYYDSRAILEKLTVPVSSTTPAPSLRLFQQTHLEVPPPASDRTVISLHGPKQGPLLTDGALTVIDESLAAGKKVVCVSPRRGYASTTSCRSCGTILACPTCGRSASIFRGIADEARCHACQTSIPLSTICPKCGSTNWSFHGYGIEQTVSTLQRLRPEAVIIPTAQAGLEANIMVDTYQAYRSIRQISNVGAVIITSGDSLLSLPDYSVAERAWHYLARLQAESGSAKVVIQTFEPESPFWQRWLHSDDRTWYSSELKERQRLDLPPFTVQWIAHWRGQKNAVDEKMATLNSSYAGQLNVRTLPPRPSTPNHYRLLLSFIDSGLPQTLPWAEVFPLPWHVDQHPTSWLD